MADIEDFKDPVETVLELVRAGFQFPINSYYEGDPVVIPNESLPCIIVEKISGTVGVGPTGLDKCEDNVSVRVVLNKNDDIGASDEVDLTERRLRRMVEGRDPTTGQYSEGSLMYVLRKHLTLGNLAFNTDAQIVYDINPRPNMLVTSEGQVLLSVRYYVPSSQRD